QLLDSTRSLVASCRRIHSVTHGRRQLNGSCTNSTGPAVYEQGLASRKAPPIEHVTPDREIRFRQTCRLDVTQPFGDREALCGGRDDILSIAPTCHQGTNTVADRKPPCCRIT